MGIPAVTVCATAVLDSSKNCFLSTFGNVHCLPEGRGGILKTVWCFESLELELCSFFEFLNSSQVHHAQCTNISRASSWPNGVHYLPEICSLLSVFVPSFLRLLI